MALRRLHRAFRLFQTPLARMRFHPLTVDQVRRETDDTVSVSFQVPDDLQEEYRFTQGQHLTLRRAFKGEEVRRLHT